MDDHRRSLLLRLARTGLAHVAGESCVARYLAGPAAPCAVVALGKAAGAMAAGAAQALGDGLVYGFIGQARGYEWNAAPFGPAWTIHTGGHPLPDQGSLDAGAALREWLLALPEGLDLKVLMSGGASACIELPAAGLTLASLQDRHRDWLGAGLDIHEMNVQRSAISQLKAGRARALCGARGVEVVVISDVPGDDPSIVGSGPFIAPDTDAHVIATNRAARTAIVSEASILGVPVVQCEDLAGDAVTRGGDIGATLTDAEPGLHVWGGETTVVLPPEPGRGGRCQSLALAAACRFVNRRSIVLLALATDGIDGRGPDAGALVDGGTCLRIEAEGIDVKDALVRADAGPALAAAGDLVQTGPTGTNVMDLVLAYVSA